MTGDAPDDRPRGLSRRGLLALATAGLGGLAGCGYRPGGGDIRWEFGTGTGPYRPDDVLATDDLLVTVNRSRRGFDFETDEWGESAEIAGYDAASGGERWEATTPPCGRPAVHEGSLYLGHEDGGLTALDADGSTRWRASVTDFPRRLAAVDDRLYALTDAGDLVAFAASGGGASGDGGASGGLWRTPVGSGDGVALTATEDGVVVHDSDAATATIRAIRRNGEERWSAEVGGSPGDGRPVVADGTVYVPAGETLVALSLQNGEERWSRDVGRLRGSPAVGDGAVYHVAGRTLHARDAEDGSVRWRFEPSDGSGFSAPPAVASAGVAGAGVAGAGVYAAGREALYSLSPADGSVRWRVESDGAHAAPLVVGRTVAVAADGGSVRGHWRT